MTAYWSTLVVLFVGAYLAGSISSAVLVCKLLGYPDPRDTGSNNPGATNVLRIAGKPAAALTLAGDVLKGIIPVLLAILFGLQPVLVALAGLLAVIGHIFPIFFQFRGGKGIATAFGLIFVLSWKVGLMTGAIWLIVFLLFRISSLAALVAFVAMPALMLWQTPAIFWPMLVLTLVVTVRHQDNIKRLLSGEEFGFKKSRPDAPTEDPTTEQPPTERSSAE